MRWKALQDSYASQTKVSEMFPWSMFHDSSSRRYRLEFPINLASGFWVESRLRPCIRYWSSRGFYPYLHVFAWDSWLTRLAKFFNQLSHRVVFLRRLNIRELQCKANASTVENVQMKRIADRGRMQSWRPVWDTVRSRWRPYLGLGVRFPSSLHSSSPPPSPFWHPNSCLFSTLE